MNVHGNTKRYVVRAGTGLRPLPSLELSGGYVVRTPDGDVGVPLTASIRPEQWADPSAAQVAVDREMRRVIDSARGLVTIEGVGEGLVEWLETQKECAPLSAAHVNQPPPPSPEDSGLALADQQRETQRRP